MRDDLIQALWPIEVGPNEGWAKVRWAIDGQEVYLRVVGDLVPIDKPYAARKERLQARHALKDGVALIADASLESRVIRVADARLLALRQEPAVLRA